MSFDLKKDNLSPKLEIGIAQKLLFNLYGKINLPSVVVVSYDIFNEQTSLQALKKGKSFNPYVFLKGDTQDSKMFLQKRILHQYRNKSL